MVSNIFTRRPPPDQVGWGQKVKIQFYQIMVMLHINLNVE